jgi:hypothetical protein
VISFLILKLSADLGFVEIREQTASTVNARAVSLPAWLMLAAVNALLPTPTYLAYIGADHPPPHQTMRDGG